MNIYLDTTNRANASALGGPANLSEIPLFPYQAEVPVTIYLRDELNAAADLLAAGWIADFVVSTTADETDTPEIAVPSSDVTIDEEAQTVSFLADCNTARFRLAVTVQDAPVDAFYGLRLYAPGIAAPRDSFRIPCRLDNVVYDASATPPPAPLSDYYIKTEVDALLAGKADAGESGLSGTVDVAGTAAGNLYAQMPDGWALFDRTIHAGKRMAYCGVDGVLSFLGPVAANNAGIEPMVPGSPIFAALLAGSVTQIPPTASQTCVVGWAASETQIFVQPYAAWGGEDEATAT